MWPGVSAVAAVAAVLIALWAHLSTSSQGKRLQKVQEEFATLRRESTEALTKMADILATQGTPETLHSQGAQLSVRLERNETGEALVIENLGPGGAKVLEFKVINAPGIVLGAIGDNVELVARETYPVSVSIAFGDPSPLEVFVRWLDGTGSERQRVQSVPFA